MARPLERIVATGLRSGLLDAHRGADLPPSVRRLGAASFFQDIASEMVYPLLPRFLAALGGGPLALGAMESAAQAVVALTQGAAGRASDRLGVRKPFVAAGYGLSTLLRPAMAMAPSAGWVVGLRLLDRLAKGVRGAPRDAIIAEAVASERRAHAFAFHRGLDHLGAAVGPLLAALVLFAVPDGLRWVFALATLPALGGWAVVQFGVREPSRTPAETSSTAAPRRAAGSRRGLGLALAAFALFALGRASDAFLLLRAGDLGLSAIGLTLLWSAFHVAKWACSAPAGRLADRFGHRRLVLAGWGLYAAVCAGFAATASAAALLPLFALHALYCGLTEGAERALVVELAGGRGLGGALGSFHLATGLAGLAASLLFGALWQLVSPSAAFASGAALAGLAASLLLAVRPSASSSAPA